MKLKGLLVPLFIITASLQAQVGINNKTPESKLDVNGNIKIGFEENNPGKKGMIRWSDANTCFEGHNGEKWNCLEYKITEGIGTPLLNLSGGENLKFNKDTGWLNNDKSNESTKNIVKLNIKEGTRRSLYDPQSENYHGRPGRPLQTSLSR